MYAKVPLSKIVHFIFQNRIDPNSKINVATLFQAGVVSKVPVDGIHITGYCDVPWKLDIDASLFDSQSIQSIEHANGKARSVYYNPVNIRALCQPHKFDCMPNHALPPPRLMKIYISPEHRGYLADQPWAEKFRQKSSWINEYHSTGDRIFESIEIEEDIPISDIESRFSKDIDPDDVEVEDFWEFSSEDDPNSLKNKTTLLPQDKIDLSSSEQGKYTSNKQLRKLVKWHEPSYVKSRKSPNVPIVKPK